MIKVSKRIITTRRIISLATIALLFLLLSPIYSFFAHQGKLPMAPYGWNKLGAEKPVTEVLYDKTYSKASDISLTAMNKKMDEIGAASLSAAVAIDGKVVWAGAIGWADIENRVEATPDTIYRIGSTSKAITATALAKLVERGVINLDEPISTYIDDLPNENWANITPRMLASHSSGIAHYNQKGVEKDYAGLYQTMAQTKHFGSVREALEIFDGTSLRSTPGEEYNYSSPGTLLLGVVMAQATNKPFSKVIADEVLKPLGLKATMADPPEHAKAYYPLATAYINRVKNGEHEVRKWRQIDLSQRLPGGGFVSTSSDLVKMGSAYFDESFISNKIRSQFWEPQKLNNGEVNNDGYALGWRYREFNFDGVGVIRNANHGGVSRGGQSWLMVLPDYNMSVAINGNVRTESFGDFGLLIRDIIIAFVHVEQQKQF